MHILWHTPVSVVVFRIVTVCCAISTDVSSKTASLIPPPTIVAFEIALRFRFFADPATGAIDDAVVFVMGVETDDVDVEIPRRASSSSNKSR